MEYLLKRIPLDLWAECQAKAATQKVSLRWVIVSLLRAYSKATSVGRAKLKVYKQPKESRYPRRAFKPRPPQKVVKPRPLGAFSRKKVKEQAKARRLTAPDLGQSF